MNRHDAKNAKDRGRSGEEDCPVLTDLAALAPWRLPKSLWRKGHEPR